MLDSDPRNCGMCGHDCLGGACDGGVCKALKLAEIPHEFVRTIGLSPAYVLVGGSTYSDGAAAIYAIGKQDGTVTRTRPPRIDGSYSSRLAGTASTLIAADVFAPGQLLNYMSHCLIADCSATVPPAGSYTFDGVQDFALDTARGRAFWFDSTSYELISTAVDQWHPASLGATSVPGQGPCRAMAQGSGRVFGVFVYGVFAVPEDGAPIPTAVSGLPSDLNIVEIAVTPETLVMLSYTGILYTAPLPSGIGNRSPDPLPAISAVTAIATSGSTLFWSGTSTIYKCTLPLCSQAVPIARDAAVVGDLVADEQAVYWLSRPDEADPTSAVMRLAF